MRGPRDRTQVVVLGRKPFTHGAILLTPARFWNVRSLRRHVEAMSFQPGQKVLEEGSVSLGSHRGCLIVGVTLPRSSGSHRHTAGHLPWGTSLGGPLEQVMEQV